MAGQARRLSEQQGDRSEELNREAAVEHEPVDVPELYVAEPPLQDEVVVHVQAEDARVEDDRQGEDDPELAALRAPETREMVGEQQEKHHGERRADVVEQVHQDRSNGPGLPVILPGELEERGRVEQKPSEEDSREEQSSKGLSRDPKEVDREDEGQHQGGQPDDRERIEIQPAGQECNRRLL